MLCLALIREASISSEWRWMQRCMAVPGAENTWLKSAQPTKDLFTVSPKTLRKRERKINVRARREEEELHSHLLGWASSLQPHTQRLQIPALSLLNNGHERRRDYRTSALHRWTIWYWSIHGDHSGSTQFSCMPTGDSTRFKWIVSIQRSQGWLWLNEVSPKTKPKVFNLGQGEAGLGKDGRETRDGGKGV